MKTDFFILSEQGRRPLNEDCAEAALTKTASCFIVCDGLGRHLLGDEASRFSARYIKEAFLKSDGMEKFAAEVLHGAQKALLRSQAALNAVNKMKTTAVVLVIDGSNGYCAHIGDSWLYRFRGGRLLGRTADHSIP